MQDAIVFNDITLSAEQVDQLEKQYGQAPKPGNYWYDKMSGLYGIAGQPALGHLYPGHELGTLDKKASNGNTKVYINNRELPQTEYIILCQILGTIVFPGSYWLDAQGNAGMQGSPFPMVNLYMAAQQNAFRGGSGDNFWSSRYAAGNSTSDGSAGYINLGGGESVTWGM